MATRCRCPPESARLALQELLDAEDPGDLLDTTVDFVLLQLPETQPERDVVVDAQARGERVALEHHGDVAVARGDVIDDAIADQHDAFGDLLEAGDHSERGRLAAPRRSDKDHELVVGDLQVEPRDGASAVWIDLRDLVEANARHDESSARAPSRASS
jgi:hypothetical protein